jgi:predicted metalloprotease with PDZ domain
MKKIVFAIISSCLIIPLVAQHIYEVDLNKIKNDVLPVKLTLSKSPQTDQVIYSFPATVPGTYDTQDFGRFVLSMNAKTEDGKKLKV